MLETFGDQITEKAFEAKANLFLQGEAVQLAYLALSKYTQLINEGAEEEIEISYPVGYRADNTPITSTQKYSKKDLTSKYENLALRSLPITSIYNLVTTIETLLGDIIKLVLIEFPGKIPSKRKLEYEVVLSAKSLEEIKLNLVNMVLNELTYKSPKDFAAEFNTYIGINFLEHPAYHKYIELKATRDIYIHNQGIANEIYISKADTLARVKSGHFLPVDAQYFLQSYECCLQITEIIEEQLDKIWPSPLYRTRKNTSQEEQKDDVLHNQTKDLSNLEN